MMYTVRTTHNWRMYRTMYNPYIFISLPIYNNLCNQHTEYN